jgi:hypothetical protein
MITITVIVCLLYVAFVAGAFLLVKTELTKER